MKTFWLSFAAEENALGAMLVDAPAPHQAIALGREIFRRQHQDPDVEIACWEVGPPATREQRHIWACRAGTSCASATASSTSNPARRLPSRASTA